jgi:hypothetical protein
MRKLRDVVKRALRALLEDLGFEDIHHAGENELGARWWSWTVAFA